MQERSGERPGPVPRAVGRVHQGNAREGKAFVSRGPEAVHVTVVALSPWDFEHLTCWTLMHVSMKTFVLLSVLYGGGGGLPLWEILGLFQKPHLGPNSQ